MNTTAETPQASQRRCPIKHEDRHRAVAAHLGCSPDIGFGEMLATEQIDALDDMDAAGCDLDGMHFELQSDPYCMDHEYEHGESGLVTVCLMDDIGDRTVAICAVRLAGQLMMEPPRITEIEVVAAASQTAAGTWQAVGDDAIRALARLFDETGEESAVLSLLHARPVWRPDL
jgi:hypothetical protein